MTRAHRLGAGVEHDEAAGPIGRLDRAGGKAGLADRRRLLVAGHTGDRHGAAEEVDGGEAELGGVVAHLGQDLARDVEEREEVVVPFLAVDVEQHRARGVGGIGRVHRARCQTPEQKAIDGAEGDLAAPRRRASVRHGVEQEGDLAGREIGIDDEAGLGLHGAGVAADGQALAQRGGAAILPDDRRRDRPPRGALPQDGRLALIGDADAGDVGGG